MTPEELRTHMFPDSEKGALAYLTMETLGAINLQDARMDPDPHVYGVWRIFTPNDSEVESWIVYLAGYVMPNGKRREVNDFESFYPPEKEIPE